MDGEAAANIEKLKTNRSRYTEWLTRSLKQVDDNNVEQSAILEAFKERIGGLVRNLQSSQNQYVSALTEDNEIHEAESQMEKLFEQSTKYLTDLEARLQALKNAASSSYAPLQSSMSNEDLSSQVEQDRQNASRSPAIDD